QQRRKVGLFYTTPDVIEYILRYTVKKVDIIANPAVKILDPACGSGNFLLKAYDALFDIYREHRFQLAQKFPGEDWSDDGIHRRIIQVNLWGADIDVVAAGVAREALLLKRPSARKLLMPNVIVCDSLQLEQKDSRDFWLSTYDYVIGNPPYLSFGLRGTQRLETGYASYLRQAFPETAEYKLSYYVLFMERGIRMLKQGGKLGFIVPDSFLLGRYYSKIRRYILENTTIDTLSYVLAPVFKTAQVGRAVICVFTRENDTEVRQQHKIVIRQIRELKDFKGVDEGCALAQNYYAGLPYNRFRLFTDLTVKSLIDKIEFGSNSLKDFSTGHTGIRSLTKQTDIILSVCQGDTWQPGLVSGAQVERYGVTYEGHWLNIHPGALYKGGWDVTVVKQRKILLRQTGYSLTACLDEHGYYHLNNLHSFIVKSNSAVSLEYLLLLLNSRLMAFYYHAISLEYGRAMAQTDIDTLELLPVRVDADVNLQAMQLVEVMQDLVRRRGQGEESVSAKIAALEDFFNQLAYHVYNISSEEIRLIEEFEKKLSQGNCRKASRREK
ncbi:MAG: paeR7IM, partial [Firmicutes bacterium]|nr:paeR7IM [Bacillota bacterium]